MRGVFWILMGVVLVPPLSTLWLAPLDVLPLISFHSPYLLGSLAIVIVFIAKGSLEIRKEKRENPRKF